ncbi:MAG: FtsX-like permease family protein, partial [Candidatus Diapherotrites archaeon]|nr:FtsX-like permease family protein [Candidatus Diapherotrites archaeon]
LLLSRRVTEETKDFTVTSAQAIQEQVSSATETLTLFLGAIAAVSLLVGAIGVANSMFTSVLEKTREIGILKALGSTNNEIVRLFVIESGLFGLIGGLIGVMLGTLLSVAMSGLGIISLPMTRGAETLVTPQLVIIAVVLSTVIGVVAGVLPARAAAKLKPVEALRYE